MLAIMGPSGCGKSTLLDTLSGRLAPSAKQSGEILVNGHKARLTYGRSAYVTQDGERLAGRSAAVVPAELLCLCGFAGVRCPRATAGCPA